MEHVYNQMHHKWMAYWNNDNKGPYSSRNKIAHDKGNFRDGVCIKPQNGLEWQSLLENLDMQNTYEG